MLSTPLIGLVWPPDFDIFSSLTVSPWFALFHCHIGKSQLLAPSETPKTTQRHQCRLKVPQCAPIVPAICSEQLVSATPSPGKHQNIVKIVKNKKITLFHCHIGKIAISSPFRDPKNDPEALLLTIIAPVCTQCTCNMLGTTFVSHTQHWKTPQHRQNREKQENHVVSLSHREF